MLVPLFFYRDVLECTDHCFTDAYRKWCSMGYNNNHAGLHMISHRRYGDLDNLEHYDEIAEEKARKKRELRERRDTLLAKAKHIEEKTDFSPRREGILNAINDPYTRRITYGNEEVIDSKYLKNMSMVSRNVMLIAIRDGKDVRKIICDAEEEMNQDLRTNAKCSMSPGWSWIPLLEKSMIFLSILADKLDCSVQEFFIDDPVARKKFVYELLDSTVDSVWESGFVSSKSGEAEIVSRFYDNYRGWTESITPLDILGGGMNLALRKEKIGGKSVYSLSYGNLEMKPRSACNYMLPGAYLREEESGKIKDTVENLIVFHPEWIDNEDHFVL